MKYEVTQYSLKALEQMGGVELKTGINLGSTTNSTEYMFKGEDVIKALNTIADKNVIIGETKYDFEGRGAVQMMPTPFAGVETRRVLSTLERSRELNYPI